MESVPINISRSHRVSVNLLCALLTLAAFAVSVEGVTCPEPDFVQPDEKPNKFIRVAPKSKYLLPKEIFTLNPRDARHACGAVGLQAATVNSVKEYWNVVNEVIDGKKLRKDKEKVHLLIAGQHLNDSAAPAYYMNPRTKKPLPFQLFPLRDGDYIARGHASSHTCVSLECCKEKCLFSANVCMAPTDTKTSVATPVIPFCQYPDDEECYREGAPPTNEPTLVPLGNTVTRIYVVSAVQKSWDEATKECGKEGSKLLSFFKNEVNETTAVMKLVSAYLTAIKVPTSAQAMWTSGVFEREFGKKEYFNFESTNDQWSYDDNRGHWEWINESLISVPDQERCLAIVNTEPQTIRPIDCTLPNYFVCFKRKDQVNQAGRFFGGPMLLPPPLLPPLFRHHNPPTKSTTRRPTTTTPKSTSKLTTTAPSSKRTTTKATKSTTSAESESSEEGTTTAPKKLGTTKKPTLGEKSSSGESESSEEGTTAASKKLATTKKPTLGGKSTSAESESSEEATTAASKKSAASKKPTPGKKSESGSDSKSKED